MNHTDRVLVWALASALWVGFGVYAVRLIVKRRRQARLFALFDLQQDFDDAATYKARAYKTPRELRRMMKRPHDYFRVRPKFKTRARITGKVPHVLVLFALASAALAGVACDDATAPLGTLGGRACLMVRDDTTRSDGVVRATHVEVFYPICPSDSVIAQAFGWRVQRGVNREVNR